MIILSCANIDVADQKYTDKYGVWYRNFSFKSVIQDTMKKAIELGYKPDIYDLGNLGIGQPFTVEDSTFAEKGYFEREIKVGYKSRSLFKPELVYHCLEKNNDLTAYLDGDAQLVDSLDEIISDDYDVGVTVRKKSELQTEWHKELFDIVKYVNAGVIFFRPTTETFEFIKKWKERTYEVGNDQKALNQLVTRDTYPEPYTVEEIDGVKIKYFPCEKYNYYYFDEEYNSGIKIMHFKGVVRDFYPFTKKKELYCKYVQPLRNIAGKIIKKGFRNKNN